MKTQFSMSYYMYMYKARDIPYYSASFIMCMYYQHISKKHTLSQSSCVCPNCVYICNHAYM